MKLKGLSILLGLLFMHFTVNADDFFGVDDVTSHQIDSLINRSFNTQPSIGSATGVSEFDTLENGAYLEYMNGLIGSDDTLFIADDLLDPEWYLDSLEQDTIFILDIETILEDIRRKAPDYSWITVNDRFLRSNPFFGDLVFFGYAQKVNQFTQWTYEDFRTSQLRNELVPNYFRPIQFFYAESAIQDLRQATVRKVAALEPKQIAFRIDKLPDVSELVNFKVEVRPIEKTVIFPDRNITHVPRKITIDQVKRNPWATKSHALLQFSQNTMSSNWYQGGSNNTSILGIVNGNFNYDNKKNVQWENFAEWRLGLNSVEGDTLRFLNTNDDVLRAISKLGIKAGGNWFYSGLVDFSTHFFNSYRAVNSPQMRATFLTPVRFNVNVGLDYKYKRLFSLMVSPISYKFIYANDTTRVNQRSFGIPLGENYLSQVGSSFRAQFSYSPVREVQVDSRLSFYTNYEKIEVDWEIVGNFRVNRFFTTRVSVNPRYDNTIILAPGEKAQWQYKQLLTFGLSYKLL